MNINEILKTEESRISFLIGLVFLSKVDGIVDEREQSFFMGSAIALDLNSEAQDRIHSSWNEEEMPQLKFVDTKEKLFFIMQAIQLANIDNSYSDIERNFIYTVAANLDIPKDLVKKIEPWVEDGIRWQTEGKKLLDLEVSSDGIW